MRIKTGVICWLTYTMWLLVACMPDNTPLGPVSGEFDPDAAGRITIEVAREGAFTLENITPDDESRLALSASEQVVEWRPGQGVAVDDSGRVVLHFGNRFLLELLQSGELLQVRQFNATNQDTTAAVAQNGGVLVADLTLSPGTNDALAVQTAFGTITASNAHFAIVRETNNALEWVLGLDVPENGQLQVMANGVSQPIAGGQARWLAPVLEPSQAILIDVAADTWLEAVRNNVAQPEIGDVLLSTANILADTGTLPSPKTDRPVEFGRDVQGAVMMTLDGQGIFGAPSYSQEDCNADGISDLAIKNGSLSLDFRALLARVNAVDVSLLNRSLAGNGVLQAFDPGQALISQQQLTADTGETQTLSVRSDVPYHTARITVSDACFFGYSLTPAAAIGQPAEVRPITQHMQSDVVVNILSATGSERPAPGGQFQAMRTNPGVIVIDGNPSDWEALSQPAWSAFATITHNEACDRRHPAGAGLVDLEGRARFAYNEQTLYVAFLVYDDGLVPYSGADNRFFLGDSPQLLLDLDLNGDFESPQLNGDDIQIDFLPSINGPQAALWQLSTLSSRILNEAIVAVTPTDTGYFMEAAIPWAALGRVPLPGDRLGVVASISDNDTPDSSAQECIISSSPQRDWRNPTTWGTMLLNPTG